jgi:tetratricopeptide (TPR) repeat protein
VALWPNLAEAYYFRAILHGHLKEYQRAIRDYTSAVELKPALIEAYYFRALNHGAAGKYEEALRDMKTAAELGYEPAKRFLESHIGRSERN